jgi:hypothetical protein
LRASTVRRTAHRARARSLRDKLLVPQRFVKLLGQGVQRGDYIGRQRLGAVHLEHFEPGRDRMLLVGLAPLGDPRVGVEPIGE